MKILALSALFALSLPLHAADTRGDLPCRFMSGMLVGTAESPQVFSTNLGQNAHEKFKTSIGKLSWAHDDFYRTIPVINGKPISISPENQGSFGNGKVYDLGGKIILAYQVERMEDSSASPSNLTVLVGPDGEIIEEHLVEGERAWEYPCVLVR